MCKALALERQFTAEPVIRPRYTPLLVTGRMSASKPNLQQAIREDWFRRQFVARPGHVLYTVDYSFIELRTLAAVCKRWFGFSVLADTILAGKDPHAYTAVMVDGTLTYDQFVVKLKEEKILAKEAKEKGIEFDSKYAYMRQKSKALNFGIPGGLGKRKLAAYAHASYGVKMSEEEAGHLRETLIKVVYPELDCYLGESDAALRLNLRVANLPSSRLARGLRSLYSRVKDAPTYDPNVYHSSGPWSWLKANAGAAPTKLRREIDRDRFSDSLERWLFADTIPTLTGRLRGGCLYSQAKNTPFQALAADGAKLALWRLFTEGYRVVAFVHDEFVLELPDNDEVPLHTRRIDRILNESMESVLGGVVPSNVEGSVSQRWSK
jgi:DNA polymerase I-like protein with 3'-5' exonuclease and polymerase domains